jgi:DNA helicase-2/ATP-dependent DNA helicase PcrA
MNNNKLIIAAAGSGKTTYLVNQACKNLQGNILITTYTEANEAEIRRKIIKIKGYIPSNITIQTWFSFLLQHGVRPFQSILDESIHDESIGFYLTSENSSKKKDKNGKPITFKNRPLLWGEKNFKKFYFTESYKIYSDKVSKFIFNTNKKSSNQVIDRISNIFDHILIDEVQDLAGFDLELLKLFFKTKSSVTLVGDPRQVTYLTHHSNKFGKYANGNIKDFVENELSKKVTCMVDEKSLNKSHRNNNSICLYSAKLYKELPVPIACTCPECRINSEGHEGVFMVKNKDVKKYLKLYKPMQLRWNSSTECDDDYPSVNFGQSKGLSFNRVLIYPTKGMKEWIVNNGSNLSNEARAKLYVGLTRARISSAIILEYDDDIDGVQKYSHEEL